MSQKNLTEFPLTLPLDKKEREIIYQNFLHIIKNWKDDFNPISCHENVTEEEREFIQYLASSVEYAFHLRSRQKKLPLPSLLEDEILSHK